MPTTHRTLDGDWALCAAPDACELLFHFPDVTPAEMAQVPEQVLWALCEVVDPPLDIDRTSSKVWGTVDVEVHRDYDLPASIYLSENGEVNAEWYQHEQRHRGHDRPALQAGDITAWFREGYLHRENGPALINRRDFGGQLYIRLPGIETLVPIQFPAGDVQYWRNGERYTAAGEPMPRSGYGVTQGYRAIAGI